jgi:predicted transcriptional regulator of viral defense system
MAKAASTVMAVFREQHRILTMIDVLTLSPELKKNEISMAFCYLLKQGYLTREKVERKGTRGRKNIWAYTFHPDRQKNNDQVQ